MAERSAIQFGRAVIPFEVRPSARRRQVPLVVQAGRRGVLVLAPANTPLPRFAAVVEAVQVPLLVIGRQKSEVETRVRDVT